MYICFLAYTEKDAFVGTLLEYHCMNEHSTRLNLEPWVSSFPG